jgi:ubiquinone/menaquinone biosynthesis C-methylase UbiE
LVEFDNTVFPTLVQNLGIEVVVFEEFKKFLPGRSVARYFAKKYLNIKRVDWELVPDFSSETSILDVGCGRPIDPVLFARLGVNVVAVDCSDEYLDIWRSWKQRFRINDKIDFVIADATRLPLRSEVFDLVISYSAIEHLPLRGRRRLWLDEMSRAARKGGNVVLTTTSSLNPLGRIFGGIARLGYAAIGSQRYEYRFHPDELLKMAEEAGLTVLKFCSAPLYHSFYFPPILDTISEYLSSKISGLYTALRKIGPRMGFCARKS